MSTIFQTGPQGEVPPNVELKIGDWLRYLDEHGRYYEVVDIQDGHAVIRPRDEQPDQGAP